MAIRWVPLYSGCVTKLCNAVTSNGVTELFKIGGIDYCTSLISLSKKKKICCHKWCITRRFTRGVKMIVPQYKPHLKNFISFFWLDKAAYPRVNAVNEDMYTTIHKQYCVLHSPMVSCLISTCSLTALFAYKYFIPIIY